MLVLLIDNHPAIVKGVSLFLQEVIPECQIMSSDSTKDILALYENNKPDIIITEIDFGRGGEALSDIQKFVKEKMCAAVIVYTSYYSNYLMSDLIEKGVQAVISKESISELLSAVLNIIAGSKCVSSRPMVLANNIDYERDPFIILNEREFSFFLCIANGSTIAELVSLYKLSQRTVNYIKSDIRKKLNAQDDIELTKIAIKYGHIQLNTDISSF
jgi:two-component system, NarL family, invasion response regulator UvrY